MYCSWLNRRTPIITCIYTPQHPIVDNRKWAWKTIMLYAPSLQISLGTRYDYERLRVSSTPPLKLGRTRGGGGVVRRKRPRAFLWLANPRLVPLRGINIRSWCIGRCPADNPPQMHRRGVVTDQEKVSGSQIGDREVQSQTALSKQSKPNQKSKSNQK